MNALFKAVKYGFTVKVKNIYIQVQNGLDVKRIVTPLAVFQLSDVEFSLDPQMEAIKQLTTMEPR